MGTDDESPGAADELMQAEALIRANFGLDPAGLDPERWARLFGEAVWLEGWRLRNLVRALAALLGAERR